MVASENLSPQQSLESMNITLFFRHHFSPHTHFYPPHPAITTLLEEFTLDYWVGPKCIYMLNKRKAEGVLREKRRQ